MATVGIDNTLKVLADLQIVSCDLIKVLKKGVGLGSLKVLLGMLDEIKSIAVNAPKALPELNDIDKDEAGRIASASYVLVRAIIAAVAEKA
jgi:hypothetical protein